VALETKNELAPSVYRIHDDPDPGKLEEFAELARDFGHRVGDVTQRGELQNLLREIRGTNGESSIKLALLKSLKRAAYSADPIGHYGLAKANYTHFTSPIRRYADLAVHRVLRKILSNRNEPTAPEKPDRTPKAAEIKDFAAHISETERIAAEAEQETRRIKIYEYLEILLSENADTTLAATIQEVRPIGAFVELDELLIRGLIRKNDLPRYGEYFFDRTRNEFRSRTNAPALRAGENIRVRLISIDRERGFVDFSPA
ncbi:MAG: RNB domain-containing ribonuclease, partial [Verrucomicrobiales bacterium]|nr:RNB domain-containing ribonuclease [Verrucomicrobiales bacterium]